MNLIEFYKVTGEQSDKGTVHCYISEWYNNEFTPVRFEKLKILEIGINKGDSLILWRDWFVNSNIYGIDNGDEMTDEYFNIVNRISNVNIQYGDAYTIETVSLYENDFFDYIIDDGPHTLSSHLKCVELWFPKLKSGGKLIIEDIWDIDYYQKEFDKLNIPYQIVDLRNKSKHNQKNDVLLVLQK